MEGIMRERSRDENRIKMEINKNYRISCGVCVCVVWLNIELFPF